MLSGLNWLLLSAFPLLLANVSCGSQNQNDSACTPGLSIQCAGENGCLGAQICNADGTAYAACACNPGGSAQGTGGSSLNSTSSAGTLHSGGTGSSLNTQAIGGSGGVR